MCHSFFIHSSVDGHLVAFLTGGKAGTSSFVIRGGKKESMNVNSDKLVD